MKSLATAIRGLVPFVALIAAWTLVSRTGVVPVLFLPPPTDPDKLRFGCGF